MKRIRHSLSGRRRQNIILIFPLRHYTKDKHLLNSIWNLLETFLTFTTVIIILKIRLLFAEQSLQV